MNKEATETEGPADKRQNERQNESQTYIDRQTDEPTRKSTDILLTGFRFGFGGRRW